MKNIFPLFFLILLKGTAFGQADVNDTLVVNIVPATSLAGGQTELIIPTFLGNSQRNYSGADAPSSLNLIWKHFLGTGETTISRKAGNKKWSGAGWTGQPLLVKEDSTLYLIQGSFDHTLKKIDASNGNLVWQYKFDDVVKGTGTIWDNSKAVDPDHRYIILQGSRLGFGVYLDAKYIPSYRAVSLRSGKELWRLNVKYTGSYSRDVDGSALIINDTVYIPLENSLFTILDPDPKAAIVSEGMLQPKIINELKLFNNKDLVNHKNNVVTESSPALLRNHIYITSGSGHVFGYNIHTGELDWDFFIGSDMDGSPVVTSDSCILVTVEKQYIKGNGGVFKLDPAKPPAEAVVWFQPTGNKLFAGWEGGVIGSAGVNDRYADSAAVRLAAFCGIDGYTYIVDHMALSDSLVAGPDSTTLYPSPELLTRRKTGGSIATPIFVDNRLVVAGYGGLWLYEVGGDEVISLLAHWPGIFESTPVVYGRRIFVASRDGYLYCLGDN